MASVRTATWGSASAREVVARIAEELSFRSAFGYCAVEVVRSDGMLEVIAVHGQGPGAADLVGRPVPHSSVETLFDRGTVHGELTFVASEWSPAAVRGNGLHPPPNGTPNGTSNGTPNGSSNGTVDGSYDPGAWQPGDLLAAQLCDDEGRLRAVVHLADPQDGRRRGPHELEELSELLSLFLRIVLTTIEHEELTQLDRITRGVRKVLRRVGHEVPVPELVERVSAALREVLRAQELTIHLIDGAGFPTVRRPTISDALYAEFTRAIERAWRRGGALIIEPGHVWGDPILDEAFAQEIAPMLRQREIGTVVLVPVSSSGQLVGVLVIHRAADAARWTSAESDAVVDVARDIGRAVLNARAYEAEERLNADLRRLDAYRSQLISTVSHELKNPIGVLSGHLEMMEGRVRVSDDPSLHRTVEAMRRGVDRLSRLTHDLLTLSRTGDPNHPLEKVRIDLGELVAEVADFAQVTADQARVEVTVTPPDADVVVDGDREELRRTVANLVSNAVKYSDPGDEVVLGVRRERAWVVLECTDTGIGISADDQAHLFDEFFRSSNPDAVRRPGTGLGLAILRRVVDRHGGRIEVDSELGRGTTFRVSLPGAGPVTRGESPGVSHPGRLGEARTSSTHTGASSPARP